MKHESDGDANFNWSTKYSHQKIDTGTGGLGNKKTCRDHPNDNFVEISQNTKKSPRNLRRQVITQTSVRNHQLTQA